MDAATAGFPADPRVVIIGPCGSGKTTLVDGLRRLGFRAMVCGQEHSEIATLWRHTAPDLVVALEVDLPTVRRRRGEEWPAWLYEVQRRRLSVGAAAADLRLDTSELDAGTVLGRVAVLLSGPGAEESRSVGEEAGSRAIDRRAAGAHLRQQGPLAPEHG